MEGCGQVKIDAKQPNDILVRPFDGADNRLVGFSTFCFGKVCNVAQGRIGHHFMCICQGGIRYGRTFLLAGAAAIDNLDDRGV